MSSTLEELAAERAAAREAIENLRLTPVMFELGARPHPPRQLYAAYLAQSDVVVGIYGERYGWVAPDRDVSGLEDEYRLAEAKPRLLYVKHPAPARDERLARMLDRIETEGAVSYRTFRDADELKRQLADDLALLLSERFQGERERPLGRVRARLPAGVDRFVGRERELAALERRLTDPHARLVTVTGPGGVGKTRLALEAARRAQSAFGDGAHFVPLSSVVDPQLVDAAIQDSLGITGASASAPVDAVLDVLRDASLLLVLDNFEQVLTAAPVLTQLLEECAGVTALVTSRTVLNLKGERDFPLAPLTVAGSAAEAGSDAVDLFVERARAANPSFAPSSDERAAIAAICRRIDGLPLAIELAAAQVRVLPPGAILDRLERRLSLSARGGGGYPDRQQTLHAAIEWSFDLLEGSEQALFARASVFTGGWTLEALEAVCANGDDVLEPFAALVEKSLTTQDAAHTEPRFSMLDTIREYAAEKLEERGEDASIQARHASFYLGLVAEVGAHLNAGEHGRALAALDREEDNVRAALNRLLEAGERDRVADAGWSLVPYWSLRERVLEGRRWMTDVLAGGELSPGARARALAAAAMLAFWGSDHATAVSLAGEALPQLRALCDETAIPFAQIPLGVVETIRGDRDAGLQLLEDSRRRSERLGNEWGVAMSMLALVWALNASEAEAPLELFEEALDRASKLGYEAETLALGALGRRRSLRGDRREAKELLADALRRVLGLNAKLGVALYLDLIGDLAAAEGADAIAARLAGAADSVSEAAGAPIPPFVRDREARLEALRARLGDSGFAAEYEAGRTRSIEDASAEALDWAAGGGERSD